MKLPRYIAPIIISAGLLVTTGFSSAPVKANINEAYYMAVAQKEALYKYGWSTRYEDIDFLNKGYYRDYTATLYYGNKYIFIVSGDNSATDMDIAIYDKYGNRMVQDNSAKAVAAVNTNIISYTQDVTIRVTMYKNKLSGSHYALTIGYQ